MAVPSEDDVFDVPVLGKFAIHNARRCFDFIGRKVAAGQSGLGSR
jgi:hypothetical protein